MFERFVELDKNNIATLVKTAKEIKETYEVSLRFHVSENMTFSQFELTLELMTQMRNCFQLCTEFPVEQTLINLINFAEGLEESKLES